MIKVRLEYVRSFISVVEQKSFSLAAKRLFLSQPTISTHIKQLEDELGSQLLIRSTKDLSLSETGKTFYPFALRLIETENEAMNQLNRQEIQMEGRITISTSTVPGHYILPDFLSAMGRQYPLVNYKVQEGDSTTALSNVLHFEAEIGLGGIELNNAKCICEELFEDTIVLATPNTPAYQKLNGVFPIEQLKTERFILRENGSGTKVATETLERDLSIRPDSVFVAAQFESTEMIKRAVSKGVGVAFMSSLAASDYEQNEKILTFRFTDKAIRTTRKIYLYYHKDRLLSGPTLTIMRELKNFTSQMNTSKD